MEGVVEVSLDSREGANVEQFEIPYKMEESREITRRPDPERWQGGTSKRGGQERVW